MNQPTNTTTLMRRDEHYLASGLTDNDTRLIWRAMMLSRSLEQCKALLRGESVPKAWLDQKWAKAFGLRSK